MKEQNVTFYVETRSVVLQLNPSCLSLNPHVNPSFTVNFSFKRKVCSCVSLCSIPSLMRWIACMLMNIVKGSCPPPPTFLETNPNVVTNIKLSVAVMLCFILFSSRRYTFPKFLFLCLPEEEARLEAIMRRRRKLCCFMVWSIERFSAIWHLNCLFCVASNGRVIVNIEWKW
jgi:hypothetical protein